MLLDANWVQLLIWQITSIASKTNYLYYFVQKNLRNRMITHIFVTKQLPIIMRRDVFQAIADPIRRDIIKLLATESLTVNEVADQFDISRPAISKHLKILNECGIIDFSQKGRERFCMIQAKNLLPAYMWMEQYKNLWEDRLDNFGNYLNKLQTKNKKNEQR